MLKTNKIIIFILLSFSFLYAKSGLTQKNLLSVEPSANSSDVSYKIVPTISYSKSIYIKSIKNSSIKLKQISPIKQIVKGNIVTDNNRLSFIPLAPLNIGVYRIKIKPIELQKDEQIKVVPKTIWQKFIANICAMFYDSIEKCPLCQYVCNVHNTTKTKSIKFKFEVKDDAPSVIYLDVNTTLVELSEYNSTQIKVVATYEDNSSEDVTQKATYSSSDSSVEIDKGVISTNDEDSAEITVSYANKSTTFNVEVYEMIEGHLLPHEPDNPDDTLLGVDKNANGVRDEVERWIYKTQYYTHSKINIAITMQKAKFYQMALIDPKNTNDTVHKASKRHGNCDSYYKESRNIPLGEGGKPMSFSIIIKDKYFNTKKRLKTYMEYNYSLSGRVFTLTPTRLLNVNYCDENIDLMP